MSKVITLENLQYYSEQFLQYEAVAILPLNQEFDPAEYPLLVESSLSGEFQICILIINNAAKAQDSPHVQMVSFSTVIPDVFWESLSGLSDQDSLRLTYGSAVLSLVDSSDIRQAAHCHLDIKVEGDLVKGCFVVETSSGTPLRFNDADLETGFAAALVYRKKLYSDW